MSSLVAQDSEVTRGWVQTMPGRRVDALADRIEQGARVFAAYAAGLTEAQWQTRLPKDGRTVGVLVHHVAIVYPLEIQLAQRLAAGQAITDVTRHDVHERNATHAWTYSGVTKEAALDLLRRNSAAAATAIRAICDEHLDRAAPVSLYDNTPVTCQFVLEDRVIRHSYHHQAAVRSALQAHDDALERLMRQLEARE
jgi:Protein of unknown function (DUF664)